MIMILPQHIFKVVFEAFREGKYSRNNFRFKPIEQ
jgi:hypothetical protein